MARRILNRKDLRADYEAAERRKAEDEEDEGDEDEGDEDEAEAEAEAEEEEGEEEEEEEEAPKRKRKASPKEPKPKRTRSAKQERQKVIWGVFNNSHQQVATFPYPKKQEALDHAAKLQAAKNPPQPFFVQPVRVAMEEK
jgi:cobalamin biosynthesis protein CobT